MGTRRILHHCLICNQVTNYERVFNKYTDRWEYQCLKCRRYWVTEKKRLKMGRKEVIEWSKIANKCGVYNEDDCLWLANAIVAEIDKAKQEREKEILEFVEKERNQDGLALTEHGRGYHAALWKVKKFIEGEDGKE